MTETSQAPAAVKHLSADELALERTLMASDRTLLAWVRTAMSFISFGFTMYKLLENMAVTLAAKIDVLQPHHLGLFLMAIGTLPLAVGMLQYYQLARKLGQPTGTIVRNPSFFLAIIILLLGIVLFFNIIFKWHLL